MGENNKLLFWTRGCAPEWEASQELGEYVQLESYMKTFVYSHDYEGKKIWRVSELYTGLGFAVGTTKKKAVNDARNTISRADRKTFLKAIILGVRRFGKFPKPSKLNEEVSL